MTFLNGYWRKGKNDNRRADTATVALQRAIESSRTDERAIAAKYAGEGESPSITIPDLLEPLYGLRAFGVEEDGFLVSPINSGTTFYPYKAEPASCRYTAIFGPSHFIPDLIRNGYNLEEANKLANKYFDEHYGSPKSHTSPGDNCGCGYYVASDVSRIMGKSHYPYAIIARVAMWGKVVEHDVGWRAQYIYPVSFRVVNQSFRYRRDFHKLGKGIEKNYGCYYKGITS